MIDIWKINKREKIWKSEKQLESANENLIFPQRYMIRITQG